MMTKTFVVQNQFEVTVLIEFFEKQGPDARLEEESFYTLVNEFNIKKYLHSDERPAIIDLVNGNRSWFLNGEEVKGPEKLNHTFDFKNTFESMLNEE